jgi:hypothetical protein
MGSTAPDRTNPLAAEVAAAKVAAEVAVEVAAVEADTEQRSHLAHRNNRKQFPAGGLSPHPTESLIRHSPSQANTRRVELAAAIAGTRLDCPPPSAAIRRRPPPSPLHRSAWFPYARASHLHNMWRRRWPVQHTQRSLALQRLPCRYPACDAFEYQS